MVAALTNQNVVLLNSQSGIKVFIPHMFFSFYLAEHHFETFQNDTGV